MADDYTVFYPTFFAEVREVGSADTDRMYGSTETGSSSAWPATTSSMATPATR